MACGGPDGVCCGPSPSRAGERQGCHPMPTIRGLHRPRPRGAAITPRYSGGGPRPRPRGAAVRTRQITAYSGPPACPQIEIGGHSPSPLPAAAGCPHYLANDTTTALTRSAPDTPPGPIMAPTPPASSPPVEAHRGPPVPCRPGR